MPRKTLKVLYLLSMDISEFRTLCIIVHALQNTQNANILRKSDKIKKKQKEKLAAKEKQKQKRN